MIQFQETIEKNLSNLINRKTREGDLVLPLFLIYKKKGDAIIWNTMVRRVFIQQHS
jgi:hypothetical protein